MPNDLQIQRQARTILGSQVKPGMVLLNPKSASGNAFFVTGGKEFTEMGLGRLFTDEPGRRQDVIGWTVGGGVSRNWAIVNDKQYELIADYSGGNVVVVD